MRAAIIFNLLMYGMLGYFLYPGSAGSDRQTEMPTVVFSTLATTFPNAEISDVSKQKKDGTHVYAVRFTNGRQSLDASYTKEGQLVELEETICSSELPVDINESIASIFDYFEIRQAEKVVKNDNVYYEIKVAGKNKGKSKRYELLFSQDAKLLNKYRI